MKTKLNLNYHKILKSIIWDYDINTSDLYDVIKGKRDKIGSFDFEKIFIRMLERLFWYDILSILGIDLIKKKLTKDIIKKIRFKELRENYEYIRKILHKESISISGWGNEYRRRIKHTLLSNRWYSSGQTLF